MCVRVGTSVSGLGLGLVEIRDHRTGPGLGGVPPDGSTEDRVSNQNGRKLEVYLLYDILYENTDPRKCVGTQVLYVGTTRPRHYTRKSNLFM